jgi:hypothetical protein
VRSTSGNRLNQVLGGTGKCDHNVNHGLGPASLSASSTLTRICISADKRLWVINATFAVSTAQARATIFDHQEARDLLEEVQSSWRPAPLPFAFPTRNRLLGDTTAWKAARRGEWRRCRSDRYQPGEELIAIRTRLVADDGKLEAAGSAR